MIAVNIIVIITSGHNVCSNKPKVLVIGGSGRVGGSAVRSLSKSFGENIELRVGGRSKEKWEEYRSRVGRNVPATFVEMDIYDSTSLSKAIAAHDLIIHTAGPFQQLRNPVVLDTALEKGKLYIDVCDDIALSRLCGDSKYQTLAKSNGASAVISTGIWPGASSLLCQELIHRSGGVDEVNNVTFSFFTAGSGGAGQTSLTATFLILGENVLVYRDGERVYYKSATDLRRADFGRGIGVREVVRLNLIECESTAVCGVRNVETFFGTAPTLWNSLFVLMAQLMPQSLLQDRYWMTALAGLSLPLVRVVDAFVGSKNGMLYIADYRF